MSIESARALLLSSDDKDHARGVELVNKLVGRGDPVASYAQATWYINGSYKFKKDLKEAEKLLRVAMDGLVPEAFYDYAVLLRSRDGRGHLKEAFSYLVVAACAGDLDASQAVANAMFNGEGCFKNVEAANFLDKVIERRSKD